jgi:phosphoribosyl 1,2-cyclic phosphodiesterase
VSPISGGLRFAYLGSGSKGNAALVEAGSTTVMLDCGFAVAETESRLARLGRDPADIAAILVTHEHSDHIGGVARFARRHRVPVWMTAGTWAAARDRDIPNLRLFSCHEPFAIGDLELAPMPVPHDAREPCQFVFSDGARRLGILTDTGHVTPHVAGLLAECDALVIECNHDLDMLLSGPYPQSLKRRVAGQLGHLNNDQARDLAAGLRHDRLQHVVAVHVSEVNNTAVLARGALADGLGCAPEDIELACQGGGLGWHRLR